MSLTNENPQRNRSDYARGGRDRNHRRGEPRYGAKDGKASRLDDVPVLRAGQNGNLRTFLKAFSIFAKSRYGLLGRMVDDREYYVPPEVVFDMDAIEGDNPMARLAYCAVAEEVKERHKIISKMKADRVKLYADLYGQMSSESEDLIKRNENYDEFSTENDPLGLLMAIIGTHQFEATAVGGLDKKKARDAYSDMKQSRFENLTAFKERFDFGYEAYLGAGNAIIDDEDIAMDFFNALNQDQFGTFKVNMKDAVAIQGATMPATLVNMYAAALAHKNNHAVTPARQTNDLSFANPRGGRGGGRGGDRGADRTPSSGRGGGRETNPDIVCWTCNQKGHYARDCKTSENKNSNGKFSAVQSKVTRSESKVTLMDVVKVTMINNGPEWLGPYDVLLDNQANLSTFKTKDVLTNVKRKKKAGVSLGVTGDEMASYEDGLLEDFFRVDFNPASIANILSLSEIEKKTKYKVTYKQGKHFRLHFKNKTNLTFKLRNGLYIADMSDWVLGPRTALAHIDESLKPYKRRSVKQALKAREIMENAGYPSENTFARMLDKGAIKDVPVEAADARNSTRYFGRLPDEVRGKTTARRIKYEPETISDLPEHKYLVAHTDVMTLRDKCHHLLTVMKQADPMAPRLDLVLVQPIASTSSRDIGAAMQEEIALMETRGYVVRARHVDPQLDTAELRHAFPNVTHEVVGAGDHVPVAENKIRTVKERCRCISSNLDFPIPDAYLTDLVRYVVSRLNNEVPVGEDRSPRHKFSNRKASYKKEYSLKFGDYCEVYNKSDGKQKNSIDVPRTVPAVALRALGNLNGTWEFLNLETNRRIRRSQWTKMGRSQFVIDHMTELFKREIDWAAVCAMHDEPPDEEEPPPAEERERERETGARDEREGRAHDMHHGDDVNRSGEDSDDADVPELIDEEDFEDDDGSRGPLPVPQGARESNVPPVRRSERLASKPQTKWMSNGDKMTMISLAKAMNMYGDAAGASIKKELQQMLDKGVFRAVHEADLTAEQRKGAIRSLMFLKEKYTASGNFEKLKSRLVADGSQQDRNVYGDSSSPTASVPALFTVFGIAADEGREVASCDIVGAFLNASKDDNKDPIYMRIRKDIVQWLLQIDPGMSNFLNPDGSVTVEIMKAMYGTVEAGRLWYDHLCATLKKHGFELNPHERCVFNKMVDGVQITIVVYVDDLIITSRRADLVTSTLQMLEDEFGKITATRGSYHEYLGMVFELKSDKSVKITMEKYLANTLEDLDVQGIAASPATDNLFVTNARSPLLDRKKAKIFHTTVAKLLYLCKRTRIDIMTCVSYLCTRVLGPTEADWMKLMRLLKYLNGTKGYHINIKFTKPYRVKVWVDASFGIHDDGKGHTGVFMTMGVGPIYCKSTKQRCVTASSAEAELAALDDAIPIPLWMRQFMIAQGYEMDSVLVYEDNKSVLCMIDNGGATSHRTRHFKVKYFLIKQRVDGNEIEMQY